METILLHAQARNETGKGVAALRDSGVIPAVVYGRDCQPINISLAYNTFERAYRSAGETSLVDLVIDNGQPIKTLIHEVQHDPVKGRFLHVDFYQVRMTEKLTTNVPLIFVGEAKAVKELGGTLVKSLDEVEVRCLPGDLVHEIEVDLTPLATFEDHITVSDLKLPKGLEVLDEADVIVASVSAPMTEEQLKALEEKPVEDVANVEVASEKGKKEEEEK